jgi:isorenieratene synthase
MALAQRSRGNTGQGGARGSLWCFGRKLPHAPLIETRPDWEQADPAWIRNALRQAQELPSGGWYVVAPTRAIGERPLCCEVAGRALVAWRAGDRLLVAPSTCPHLGASLCGAEVQDEHLICPWHGLALGPNGHEAWNPLPTYDDGTLLWVRLEHAGEAASPAPYFTSRPVLAISGVIETDVTCDARDVIANRLDPWHGTHFHRHAFARLRVIDQPSDRITVRVAYRIFGRIAVEVDACFHCVDPRTIAMTILRGEGEGSVVETHATPIAPGRTRVIEAVFATSDRPGFKYARLAARVLRPFIEYRARKLWREDAVYAERLYSLRHRPRIEAGKVVELYPPPAAH